MGFLNNPRTRTNNSGAQTFVIDPHSEEDREQSEFGTTTRTTGACGGELLVEAQFSQRRSGFTDDGGTSTAIVDSPFFAFSCACIYNAPYFDASDPENRNNRQLTGSVTNFWNLGGRHESKGGYEWFRSQRTGGNSQSSTSYVFNSDFRDRRQPAPRCSMRRARHPGVRARESDRRKLLSGDARRRRPTSTTTRSTCPGSLDDQRRAGRPTSARASST